MKQKSDRMENGMSFIKKNIKAVMFFSTLAFIICMLIVVHSYDKEDNASFYKNYNIEELTNGWTVTKSTGETQKVSLPFDFTMNDGIKESISIMRNLPEEMGDTDTICFRTSHSRVAVFVGTEMVYDFAWDTDIPLGESPGSIWNVVELKPEYAGKTLTIYTKSSYSEYNGLFRSVMYGSRADIMLYLLDTTSWMFILSNIPLVLGLILIAISFFAWKFISSKPFVYVGIFLTAVGIWEITESGYIQFIDGNAFTIQILNFLVFAFIPLTAIMALKYTNLLKYHFEKLLYINVGVFFAFVLAQFVGLSDMQSSLWIIHITMVVDSIYVYIDAKKYYEEIDEKGHYIFTVMTYSVILVSVLIDIYRFYVFPESYNGEITRYGIIIFILLMSINIIFASLAVQRSNVEKETIINMAYTDNLTGINNRRCFEEDTEKLVDSKTNFTVVAVDMNNLKMINDELGHKFGDEALIKVANGLKRFEEFGEKCYRMGGDEFEVICTKMTGEQIDSLCSEINAELGKTEYFPGKPLSMAYGYFRFSANMDKEVNKVLAQADKKMYEKKAKMKAMGYATRD